MKRRLFGLILLLVMALPLTALAQRYETLRYRDEGPAVLQLQ